MLRFFAVLALTAGLAYVFGSRQFGAVERKSSRFEKLVARAGRESATKRFVLVNFWASWCPPCMEETPSLADFAEKNAKDFVVVSVSEDGTRKELDAFLKAFPKLRANAIVVADADGSLGREFGVAKLPESFAFETSTGRYLQISGSVDWRSPEILSRIEAHFSASK